MCACDRSYVCERCARFENREPDDREREEADRYRSLMYGAESLSDGTEA